MSEENDRVEETFEVMDIEDKLDYENRFCAPADGVCPSL